MHSEDQQPYRQLNYSRAGEFITHAFQSGFWPPGGREGPPINVHTEQVLSASALHGLFYVTTNWLKVSHLHKVG